MGFAVDAVEELPHLAAEDVEVKPDFGGPARLLSLPGLAKVKSDVKNLLDLDRLPVG